MKKNFRNSCIKYCVIFFTGLLSLNGSESFCQTFAQNNLDSLNAILDGEWVWNECFPAPFECAEQPSEYLSRSILFTPIGDSVHYETYKNGKLITNGKTKLVDIHLPKCIITADVVFGEKGSNACTLHRLIFESDTTLKFKICNYKSSVIYKYKKKVLNTSLLKQGQKTQSGIRKIFYQNGKIYLTVNILNTNSNLVFKVYNMHGNILYEQRLSNGRNRIIQISNIIPPGMYLGSLYSDNVLIDCKKIIIYAY